MNKIFKWLFMAVMFASMCACSSDNAVQQLSQVETSVVNFSFFDASIEKFNAATRAETIAKATWKSYFSRMDIALIPVDTSVNDSIYRIHQVAGKDNFGSFSMRLPIGKYTLVAIASKAKQEVDIVSSSLAVFPDQLPTDMAYVCKVIDVKSGSTTVSGMLKRSLVKFMLNSTDSVAKDISKLEIKMIGHIGNALNPTTGYGVEETVETTAVKSWSWDDSNRPSDATKVSLYAFIPLEESTVQVLVNVFNVQGMIVRSLKFDNVKLQQNHVTTYSGPLYSSGSTFEFTFDNVDFKKSDYDNVFGD